jgi:hypothetical protein
MHRKFLIQLDIETADDAPATYARLCATDGLRRLTYELADTGFDNVVSVHYEGPPVHAGAYGIQMEELDLTATETPEPTVTELPKLTPQQGAMLLAACRYMEYEVQTEGMPALVMDIATNAGLYDVPEEGDYDDLADRLAGLTTQPTITPEPSDASPTPRYCRNCKTPQTVNEAGYCAACDPMDVAGTVLAD